MVHTSLDYYEMNYLAYFSPSIFAVAASLDQTDSLFMKIQEDFSYTEF